MAIGIKEYQDQIVFKHQPEITNRNELANSLMSLTTNLMSEVGEYAKVIGDGMREEMNYVDVLDESMDIVWNVLATWKLMDVNPEDVLDAHRQKLRLRYQISEPEKNKYFEKQFFEKLIEP